MTSITMLGTASAFPKNNYNTCFLFSDSGSLMLVDAGGGNQILQRLSAAGIAIKDIRNFFITHSHTDHLLGAVWVVRAIANAERTGSYGGRLNLYANREVIEILRSICSMTLTPVDMALLDRTVDFIEVSDGTEISFGSGIMRFIDVASADIMQTGFDFRRPDGTNIVCLGDESLNARNCHLAKGASVVLSGAFCLYADRHIFHPYEKNHFTVADVAAKAQEAGVGTLLLYHTEDTRGAERKNAYEQEAAASFAGKILVPDDMETVVL